ncbi:MAG TPA: sigma-70 family RNA polymerase sigma factor, partial [Pyrinomonadaceae bacterium]|nr:sigma-70 family RNA polymerase sigma factor [Pyrinomonadaceae bacterium]
MTENEAELVKRAQARDTDAFCQLSGIYQRRIYSLALHYCHDPQDAEDLSQEVWLKAFQAIGTFRQESTFYTWIRRITINCFLNRQRTSFFRWRKMTGQLTEVNPYSEQPTIQLPNIESTLNNRILFANVMRALAQLTPRQRLIFLLKHHEGMTYEEISAAVGTLIVRAIPE